MRNAQLNATRPLILIVDDKSFNLSLLNTTLKEHYRVMAAISGREALAAVERNKPDLILLDVLMPDIDGYEVCRILKSQAATRDIPIIFLSSMDSEADRAKGLKVGADGYLYKPFRSDVVLSCLRDGLANRRRSDVA